MTISKDFNFSNYLKNFEFSKDQQSNNLLDSSNLGFKVSTLDNYMGKDKPILKNSKKSLSSKTVIEKYVIGDIIVKKFINEYWTSKQRQGSSIHEISYRACFKSQLPRFFIKVLSKKNDIIYDPFSGRGTTIIEACLMGRNIILNDINPLSVILAKPRLEIPDLIKIEERLNKIDLNGNYEIDLDLSMFYHPKTETEIRALRNYLRIRKNKGIEDYIDRWIRMIATNRLTGHSKGFFSVYTLPPNQAVSQESQKKINLKRNQIPSYRNVKKSILKKSKNLVRNVSDEQKKRLLKARKNALFLTKDARRTEEICDNSVQLIITSPPFLNIVQYSKDNWLRCWFNSLDVEKITKEITMAKTIEKWSNVMQSAFNEFYRIIKPGGWVVFEVGEIKKGKVKLDEFVVPLGIQTGFNCKGILINSQSFTKTSNIWGISNNKGGTNTNRIVVFRKLTN